MGDKLENLQRELEAMHRQIEQVHQDWMAALNAVRDPIFMHDTEFRIVRCNRAYQQCAGMPMEQIIGQPYFDVFPKTGAPLRHCQRTMEEQSSGEEEDVVEGDAIYRSRSFITHNAQGVDYAVHILEDITERREIENYLKLSRALIDNSSDDIEVLDPATLQILDVNETTCRTLGYSREELLSMNITDIDPALDDKLREKIKTQLDNLGSARFESVHRRKDGSVFPVEVSAKRVELDRPYALDIVRDITERKRMENALHDSEEMLRSMSANTHDALIMMDADGRISFWNMAAENIFGYPAQEAIGRELHSLIAPKQYYEAFSKAFPRFRETGEGAMISQTREIIALHKQGHEFPVELSLAALRLKDQWHAVGVLRDITERKRAEETLRENESRLKDMFENLRSGVAVYRASADGQDFFFTTFNQAAEQIEQVCRTDLLGKSATEVFPCIAESGLLDTFRRVWESGTGKHALVQCRSSSGEPAGWRDNYVYKLPNGELVAIYDDVTKEKEAEERMRHLAHYDALTNLPNRALFADRLRQAIALARREKTSFALLFLDLDKFKCVNDELGHDVGDLLLQAVALRLLNCLRESDTVSRMGGDEFVILLLNVKTEQAAIKVAEKILHAMAQPFQLGEHTLQVSSSIGVAIYPEHGNEEELLIKHADTAMYYAKSCGRNNVQLYQTGIASQVAT